MQTVVATRWISHQNIKQNMETIKIKALGMEGNATEPSSVEEFDQIAKKAGTCLQRAREYVRFHITLGDVRSLFLHGQEGKPTTDTSPEQPKIIGVEESSGIDRKTKPVLKEGKPVVRDGEAVTEYDETEGKFFDRVIATLVADGKFATEEDAKASFQPLFDQVISIVGFPAEASQRKASGPKKLAAKYKQSAAVVLTRGTTDRVNNNQLAKINKTFTATNDTSKMFTGKASVPTGKQDDSGKPVYAEVDYNVSDKDAEALGWLLKEYSDWKSTQDMLDVASA